MQAIKVIITITHIMLQRSDQVVALLGYSCESTHAVFGNSVENGSARLDLEGVLNDIRNCKENTDMIDISLHWGDEEVNYPKTSDISKAHQIIDAGADLIIGHHAHIMQSVELYKGKCIYYGLGNFIFPDFKLPSHYDGEKFRKIASKIQVDSNRQSIVVNIDKNLNVTHQTIIFKNNTVNYNQVDVPK